MFDLSGHVALVTGSSRGIGLSAARALARQGATVIINGRKTSSVQETVSELIGQGLKAQALVFDIEDIPAMLEATDALLAQVGKIDILIANAAIQHREPLARFPLAQFERIIAANLTSQWALGQHLARGMTERQYGRIVFTGSITALRGRENITAYTAAKAALHGLVRQWASELSPQGVTVNAIAPGYIKTELSRDLWANTDFTTWLSRQTPIGRWGSPEDIAAACVYLSAQEAGYVTGQVLTVDGGLSATLM